MSLQIGWCTLDELVSRLVWVFFGTGKGSPFIETLMSHTSSSISMHHAHRILLKNSQALSCFSSFNSLSNLGTSRFWSKSIGVAIHCNTAMPITYCKIVAIFQTLQCVGICDAWLCNNAYDVKNIIWYFLTCINYKKIGDSVRCARLETINYAL